MFHSKLLNFRKLLDIPFSLIILDQLILELEMFGQYFLTSAKG